jgi:hypothetical protein
LRHGGARPCFAVLCPPHSRPFPQTHFVSSKDTNGQAVRLTRHR